MKIQKYNLEKDKKGTWSSGTTTELLIYPESSSFKKRDFDYRLSIATVDESPSIFTEITGYERCLTVLDGKQNLQFVDSKNVELKKLDAHFFSGGSITKCIGLSTNYNLIFKPNRIVDLIKVVAIKELKLIASYNYCLFSNENFTIKIENKLTLINANETLHITENKDDTEIRIESNQKSAVIIHQIGPNN